MVDDKVIAIDIDGTVCTVEIDYRDCKLMPGCIEAFAKIRQKGYKIYLHTGRHINNFDTTVNWLKENGVEYDLIIFGKPPAKYYIDDRAVRFESWKKTMEKIVL